MILLTNDKRIIILFLSEVISEVISERIKLVELEWI